MVGKTDYTWWTKEALVKRIQELEAEQNNSAPTTNLAPHSTLSPDSRPSESGAAQAAPLSTVDGRDLNPKKKKSDKKIDPSRYTTRLVAFKLAYIGKNYGGFEFQASSALSTIEEELWKALVKSCLIWPENPEEVRWDDWEYSKCGRTDRGVSAFGQVIAVRVRSSRPPPKRREQDRVSEDVEMEGTEVPAATKADPKNGDTGSKEEPAEDKPFDDFKDELQYCRILNRLLPSDIRVLAWCPTIPAQFSARHDCRERQYRYFFTQPAYSPIPHSLENPKATAKVKDGWLDIDAMRKAAKMFEGAHDFRNFCKIDPSKLITNFERKIFECDIVEVKDAETSLPYLDQPEFRPSSTGTGVVEGTQCPKVYYFHVKGSAFLWHQIRCMVAVIFTVGQGLEAPEIVNQLLDHKTQPRRPNYVLASEYPLVLWDCFFPKLDDPERKDAMDWVYLGEDNPLNKHGANGLVDDMWEFWRERKMDEILSGQLLNMVTGLANINKRLDPKAPPHATLSQRTFEGGNRERLVGKYQPMMKKSTLPAPEDTYEKEAKRKGYTSAAHWREERNKKSKFNKDVVEEETEANSSKSCHPILRRTPLPYFEQAASDPSPNLFHNLTSRQQLGEYDDDLLLALHHDHQVVSDLEPTERLVDQHILDLLRGDEPGGRPAEDGRARARRLYPQPAQDQKRLRGVDALDRGPEQQQAGGQQRPERHRGSQAHGEAAGRRGQGQVEEVQDEVERHDLGRPHGRRGGRGAAVGRQRPLCVQEEQRREPQEEADQIDGGEQEAEREALWWQARDGELGRRWRGPPDV
ncbi:hypothetical protein SCAR479_04356 [Seiridium cardinale]|uniref:Pseudouridine synthase I TruA alpha/beta domain-containing protein n=1 Tax=Seiridium cardinale TaxID=138064 RepID=A0ABR2XY34_9PEZI